jgi:2-oxoacid dehydrogenase-like protein with E3 subunit-binding domain
MAQSKAKPQRSAGARSRGNSSSTNGKRNTAPRDKDGALRPAQQARREFNDADREYRRYITREEEDRAGPPDVLLDVPELRVDSIHLEVDDLDAHVALKAKVLNLVKLNVGLDVHLSRVKLDIKGVEAELVLKARLDHVAAIVDRLMTSLDRNPELVKGLSKAVSQVGEGAGEAVGKTGDAAKEVGQGAQGALQDVGKGAGEATGDIGQGAGQAVGDVGQGAGQAVGDIGQGAGQAAGNLGGLVGGVEQTVGQAGQALGGLAGGQQQPSANGGTGQEGPSPGAIAKEMAKLLGQAASGEARDISIAATRKVRELGERREQRRVEKYHATEAAIRMADELGLDLTTIDGSGAEGRITVKDVREAQEA